MREKGEFLEEHDYPYTPEISRSDFPASFVFGVATSSYQIEGGCKDGGRGPSIWDAFTHVQGNIIDGSNGDVAVDHYHRFQEDVELISKLGFNAYRFSISWSRIFPDGLGVKVNDEGVAFYNNLINALLEKGIQPYATLYHWDLPLHLQESMGGWLNKEIVEYFGIYADTCFACFGDRVKNWITLNEPLQTAVNGHDNGTFAPGIKATPFLASHFQILAHAKAVSIYRSKYKEKQGGQIGFVVDCEWAEPNSSKIEDKLAAERRLDFHFGWYLHPLYYGDYPETMRETLGEHLPTFSEEDKELLKNSTDFIGLNHYTSRFIAHDAESSAESSAESFYLKTQAVEKIAEWEGGEPIGEKAASEWLYICPWGLRETLNYMAKKYNNPRIYITENGMDDEDDKDIPVHEMLDDKLRVRFYKGYLGAVGKAIKDGVDVRGYFAWSLLDNFEWACGYTKRFGLVYVDYENGLARHPKSSAYWFRQFLTGAEKSSKKQE